jgi:hypothetical protein
MMFAREQNDLMQELKRACKLVYSVLGFAALALTLLCAPNDLLCSLLTNNCVGPCRGKG